MSATSPELLYNSPVKVLGLERNFRHASRRGIDRSDQKTRIHVLFLSLGGVRLKRAEKHL
jgi:hypothetical protein